MAEIAKRPGDLLECPLRQPDRAPLGASYTHVLTIIVQRHRAKEIGFILAPPNVRRIIQSDRRQHAIHEDEERLVIRPEQRLPMRQPVNVVARRPAFPHVARLLGRSAGELAAFHIDEQASTGRPQDDEVEVLDRHVAEHRAARFINGDVAQALLLEERLERRLVGVAAVHGNHVFWVYV
jgi:hypothetical protein